MHAIDYSYSDNQNRLSSINATGLNSSNYLYDRLGNLTRDGGEGITIAWNTSGKVKSVTGDSSPLDFSYSALGQRQMKAYQADGGKAFDYYIHDATGNIMAIYTLSDNYSRFQLKEQHIYGSGRLGIYNRNIEVYPSEEVIPLSFTRGVKRYELSNHLGNVNAVISDRKIQFKGGYMADIKSYVDYYPFGYQIPERTWSSSDYRFGFNGQEKDDEIYGEGKTLAFEARVYHAALGRWFSIDPLQIKYPGLSPYAYCGDNPILYFDYNGKDFVMKVNNEGTPKTIILTQTIYTTTEIGYNQVNKAAQELRDITRTATIDGVEYQVSFVIEVKHPDSEDRPYWKGKKESPIEIAERNAGEDMLKTLGGNRFLGTTEYVKPDENGDFVGGNTDRQTFRMFKMYDYKRLMDVDFGDIPQLIVHEILHNFGLDDLINRDGTKGIYYDPAGRMKYTASLYNIKLNSVSNEDIANIIRYALRNSEDDKVFGTTKATIEYSTNSTPIPADAKVEIKSP